MIDVSIVLQIPSDKVAMHLLTIHDAVASIELHTHIDKLQIAARRPALERFSRPNDHIAVTTAQGNERGKTRSDAKATQCLQPHRHHDVTCVRSSRRMNQAAAVRVGEPDLNLLGVDRAQRIQQVIHIEPDLNLLSGVGDLHLVLRLLLLRVMCLNYKHF